MNSPSPVTCMCPHPTLYWKHGGGHMEILFHARILRPIRDQEKKKKKLSEKIHLRSGISFQRSFPHQGLH